MTKRMLIDATHAEETRVVVLDGSRLEDFDVETSTKKQLKGNIYLAKVVRVEPSLQAAFVDYGGNRHGFLAFSEIHPDYYQIPVADRQRLLELQAEEAQREQEEEDREASRGANGSEAVEGQTEAMPADVDGDRPATPDEHSGPGEQQPSAASGISSASPPDKDAHASAATDEITASEELAPLAAWPLAMVPERIAAVAEVPEAGPVQEAPGEPASAPSEIEPAESDQDDEPEPSAPMGAEIPPIHVSGAVFDDVATEAAVPADDDQDVGAEPIAEQPPPETLGGDHDTVDESRERRIPPRFMRNYKIQEVIKRRQILLVQVVKEERGTKGAALTTYLSLAGRYCVLMPNSPRGGGISRKITSAADRRRLKEVIGELELPRGMGLIVRTAGANRPKPEIKRDCEYLLRLWDDIREHTLRSVAPSLIYEEASLIKRAIRDVYSRDIDEIAVDGEEGWRAARDFMRMLMPSHAKKVQLWRESVPLFSRYQVDAQLDAVLSPTVQLRSGGYLVINQTEALVAIDVNSGRSTRERGIEETALRTDLEAAEEVARQLRLRDLAGLIVIDFIDMESKKHNAMVERRLKDALKADRARIQVGHISHFGLMEMSRQRMRPSLAETSFISCPHCGGTGHLRSTESAAIHVLRGVEEEAAKRRSAEIVVHVALPIAMYVLNHKRDRLADIESRYGLLVTFAGDDTMIAPQFHIERVRAQAADFVPAAIRPEAGQAVPFATPEVEDEEADVLVEATEEEGTEEESEETDEQAQVEAGADGAEDAERRRRKRRRRRRGRREEAGEGAEQPAQPQIAGEPGPKPDVQIGPNEVSAEPEAHIEGVPEHTEAAEDDQRGRRRGRRGGRRRRRDGADDVLPEISAPGAQQPDLPPLYAGPTPADPFGKQAFDIFDVLERAEQERVGTVAARPALPSVAEPARRPEPVLDIAPEPEATALTSVAAETDAPAVAVETPIAPAPEPAGQAEAPAPTDEPATAKGAVETPTAANDTAAAEPAIQPIVVGVEDSPPAEKKRGWWRR